MSLETFWADTRKWSKIWKSFSPCFDFCVRPVITRRIEKSLRNGLSSALKRDTWHHLSYGAYTLVGRQGIVRDSIMARFAISRNEYKLLMALCKFTICGDCWARE